MIILERGVWGSECQLARSRGGPGVGRGCPLSRAQNLLHPSCSLSQRKRNWSSHWKGKGGPPITRTLLFCLPGNCHSPAAGGRELAGSFPFPKPRSFHAALVQGVGGMSAPVCGFPLVLARSSRVWGSRGTPQEVPQELLSAALYLWRGRTREKNLAGSGQEEEKEDPRAPNGAKLSWCAPLQSRLASSMPASAASRTPAPQPGLSSSALS